jgi:hypothetical protein
VRTHVLPIIAKNDAFGRQQQPGLLASVPRFAGMREKPVVMRL